MLIEEELKYHLIFQFIV